MLKKTSAFTILVILLFVTILFSISIGSVKVSHLEIIQGVLHNEGGKVGIIRDIRIPRVVLGILVGANLSVAGVLLQSVMKNPLADPGIGVK